MIDGTPYLDGGCSCAIPYRWAMDQGYEKILVIRTRDRSFRNKDRIHRRADVAGETGVLRKLPGTRRILRAYPAVMDQLMRREQSALNRIYRRYPALAEAFMDSFRRYNVQCDELERLDREGRLLHLCPSRPIRVSRIEGDVGKLQDLYFLGRDDCLNALPTLRRYLGA